MTSNFYRDGINYFNLYRDKNAVDYLESRHAMLARSVKLKSIVYMATVIFMVCGVGMINSQANAQEHLEAIHQFHHELLDTENPQSFDHIDTGFPLVGNHANLPCEQCHQNGVYERLPRRCDYCHNNIIAVGKPAYHVVTNAPCDTCHTIATFMDDIELDHTKIEERCIACHVGQRETAKPDTHIISSDDCDACHNNRAWIPVTVVDHAQLFVGSCVFCHNEIYAQGKDSSSHMATTDACEACHSAFNGSWLVNYLDHAQTTGVCESCHNRVLATGPEDGHLGTLVNCDACHNVVDWSVIFYDHSIMPNKQCAACHDGIMTSGKSADHLASSNRCRNCHNVGAQWQTDFRIDHNEVRGICRNCHKTPANHKSIPGECDQCHSVISWNIVESELERKE